MAGRRETLRRELLAAVREAAQAQLAEVGPAHLSLRAIAREVGISPAGLYRYYDGRDALLTMLITDGYDDLADHLLLAQGLDEQVDEADRGRRVDGATSPDASPAVKLRAVWRTYRSWALEHPNTFHLLFGEPVAGYAAPPDGATVRANARMARALILPVFEAWQAGDLDLDDLPAASLGLDRLADAIAEESDVPVTAAFAARTLTLWSVLHGAVALELNGQFLWLEPDGQADLFEAVMATALPGPHRDPGR